jgi:hypothetical protein
MMRVFYGSLSGRAHRHQCKGDNDYNGTGLCTSVGRVRVDRAVASQLLEALPVAALDSQAVQLCRAIPRQAQDSALAA